MPVSPYAAFAPHRPRARATGDWSQRPVCRQPTTNGVWLPCCGTCGRGRFPRRSSCLWTAIGRSSPTGYQSGTWPCGILGFGAGAAGTTPGHVLADLRCARNVPRPAAGAEIRRGGRLRRSARERPAGRSTSWSVAAFRDRHQRSDCGPVNQQSPGGAGQRRHFLLRPSSLQRLAEPTLLAAPWDGANNRKGLYQSVSLRASPPVHIADIRVQTSLARGRVTAICELFNSQRETARVRLSGSVRPWPSGPQTLSLPEVVAELPGYVTTTLSLEAAFQPADVTLWQPDHPALYSDGCSWPMPRMAGVCSAATRGSGSARSASQASISG